MSTLLDRQIDLRNFPRPRHPGECVELWHGPRISYQPHSLAGGPAVNSGGLWSKHKFLLVSCMFNRFSGYWIYQRNIEHVRSSRKSRFQTWRGTWRHRVAGNPWLNGIRPGRSGRSPTAVTWCCRHDGYHVGSFPRRSSPSPRAAGAECTFYFLQSLGGLHVPSCRRRLKVIGN